VQIEEGPPGSVPTLIRKDYLFQTWTDAHSLTFNLLLSVMLLKIIHSNSSITHAFQFASQTKYERTKNKTILGWLSGSWMTKQGPAKANAGSLGQVRDLDCMRNLVQVQVGTTNRECVFCTEIKRRSG
jgi:hypothetical protein